MVLGHNGTIQVWRPKAVLPYSCDAGNILQCSSDQSTDLFLELSINYIKYHLDQLLLTRFIENCMSNNTNLPFMPDLMHTIWHTPLTIPTKTLSLLHLVSFILSFSHSLPLSLLVSSHLSLIPSDCRPIPRRSVEEWEDIPQQWRVMPLQDDRGICQTPEEIQQFVIVQPAEACEFW